MLLRSRVTLGALTLRILTNLRDIPEALGSGAITPTTCGHAAICRGQSGR